MTIQRVSVHGGHSGQFCNHAENSLEEVVQTYISKGFVWVGLTEHLPPVDDAFLYPEERKAGLTADAMLDRFDRYMEEARRLQRAYADRIDILVGFETEDTTGGVDFARRMVMRHSPDYIVGSVHHIHDIPFDYSPEAYRQAVDACGGVEALYCHYFDRQFEMIRQLTPGVVAHFDLIRLFDSAYRRTLLYPSVQDKITRNLELIKKWNLILDFNVAALKKGAFEPYISLAILNQVRRMEIAVAPGDDSHGAAQVGLHLDEGIRILKQMGFDTRWPRPCNAMDSSCRP